VIENLVKLLRAVGEIMESVEDGPEMIDMYFERIEKVMNMDGFQTRLRFILLNTTGERIRQVRYAR
jgi:translation initiation factor 4G